MKKIELSNKKIELFKKIQNTKNNIIFQIFFSIFIFIFIFALSSIPIYYQESGNISVIFTKNATLTLTPVAIIFVLLYIIQLAHLGYTLFLIVKNKKEIYLFKNLKTKINWIYLASIISILFFTLIVFSLTYCVPDFSGFTQQKEFTNFINFANSLNPSNITQEQNTTFINYVNQLNLGSEFQKNGLNPVEFIANNTNNASFINFINQLPVSFNPKFFTPLLNIDCGFYGWNPVLIFIKVFFSLFTIYFFISLITLWNMNRRALNENRVTFKQRKEMFKLLAKEYKQKLVTKKQNRAKRKELLNEEEKLLTGLNKFEQDLVEEEVISQEELQEKISQNNETKKRILELQEKQRMLKEDSKIFKTKNQKQEINKRSTRIKKQEITIPDAELEEIFKNLDL